MAKSICVSRLSIPRLDARTYVGFKYTRCVWAASYAAIDKFLMGFIFAGFYNYVLKEGSDAVSASVPLDWGPLFPESCYSAKIRPEDAYRDDIPRYGCVSLS